MKRKHIKGSLYGIGFGETLEAFSNNEWIISESINKELLDSIAQNKYRLILLKTGNIFSHEMNVLRKFINGKESIKVLLGAQEILHIIQSAMHCSIDINKHIIIIDNISYQFGEFDYFLESSEIIEYDIMEASICYKPDYYYNEELSRIIAEGFTKSGKELLDINEFYSYSDSQNRVWSKGNAWPYIIMQKVSQNPDGFYNHILKYLNVLSGISKLSKNINTTKDQLVPLLIEHYKYSLLFSFLIPYLSGYVIAKENTKQLEKVYSLFAENTPLQNKQALTDITIEKMTHILKMVHESNTSCENAINTVLKLEKTIEIETSVDAFYFITNMISDLRRCVINILIENNTWFASICKHRKKPSIY